MLPTDSTIQAEYSDGFILDENKTNDESQYQYLIKKDADGNNTEGNNTFADILFKRPEAEHGQLVRFSVFWKNNRYDIDWKQLPDNARPIRFRHGFYAENADGTSERGFSGVDFGFQYTDENGQNQQHVEELR